MSDDNERDAARYRWLVRNGYGWPEDGRAMTPDEQAEPVALFIKLKAVDGGYIYDYHIDAAIDAAMAAGRSR